MRLLVRHPVASGQVDGDRLCDGLNEEGTRLRAHQLFTQQPQQRIQGFIVKGRSVSQPGVGRVRARQIMEEVGISESRRVRGLGQNQISALLSRFDQA